MQIYEFMEIKILNITILHKIYSSQIFKFTDIVFQFLLKINNGNRVIKKKIKYTFKLNNNYKKKH